jgi:hypothetical protein
MLEKFLKRARPSVTEERSGPVVRPSIDCGNIEGQCDDFKAAPEGQLIIRFAAATLAMADDGITRPRPAMPLRPLASFCSSGSQV